jgi:hypothetical protein
VRIGISGLNRCVPEKHLDLLKLAATGKTVMAGLLIKELKLREACPHSVPFPAQNVPACRLGLS